MKTGCTILLAVVAGVLSHLYAQCKPLHKSGEFQVLKSQFKPCCDFFLHLSVL